MDNTFIIDPDKLQRLTIKRNKDNTFDLSFESVKELISKNGCYKYQEEKSWTNEIIGCKIKSIKIKVEIGENNL